jgi:PAS domain S-box-containing protein
MTRTAVMKVTSRRRSTGAIGLEGALAGTGDGAAIIGSNGRIAFWNAAAERILGRTSREVLGRPCCDVFVGYDDNGNMLCTPGCQIMSLVRLGEPVHSFDMRTRTKAGRPVWINVSVLSTKDAQGPLIVHLFRDVTAAKELVTLIHERLRPALPSESDGASALSRREWEVLRLLAEGLGNAAIAERLSLNGGTIRNYVGRIFTKLGVHSRLQAVAYASKHRIF